MAIQLWESCVFAEAPTAGCVSEPPCPGPGWPGRGAAAYTLSTSTLPALARADPLFRTFRGAVAQGEVTSLTLTYRGGKVDASLGLGETAGPPRGRRLP